MAESEKAVPLALSLPDSLVKELDRVAEEVKESRSYVMRKAIREGLPLVKTGGDVIALDSELSRDVDEVAQALEWNRARVLIESVRAALPSLMSRNIRIENSDGSPVPQSEMDDLLHFHSRTDPDWYPYGREMVGMRKQIRYLEQLIEDLMRHVPAAGERYDLMMRLLELRRRPGGFGGVMPWGVANDELKLQIELGEKYGPDINKWPRQSKTSAPKEEAPQSAQANKTSKPEK